MKRVVVVLMAGVWAAGSAQAQFVHEGDRPALLRHKLEQPDPFGKSFHPYPRTYAINEGVTANVKLFEGLFKTDPRLLFGVALTPNLALEAGYVNLFDRGFHRIDERDAGDMNGALGTRGFSIHAAVRYTLPVTDRLSVYGKLGKAHSARPLPTKEQMAKAGMAGLSPADLDGTDTGLYTGAGAKFKVNDKTTITSEIANHGNARKWGKQSNSSGLRANLKMGF